MHTYALFQVATQRVSGCGLPPGVFPPGWYRSVQQVALKSPLLLSMGAGQYLDKELELNRPLKIDNIGQVRGRGFSQEWVCFQAGMGVASGVGIGCVSLPLLPLSLPLLSG